MKMKNTLLVTIATLGFSFAVMAQNIPNYIPANGLVCWWPFNGNSNDESGNGHNGTVSGATLTMDRFGLSNGAYSFDGISNKINVAHNAAFDFTEFTISCWALSDGQNIYLPGVISKCQSNNSGWYIIRNTNLQDSLSFGGRISNNNYFKANDAPMSTN